MDSFRGVPSQPLDDLSHTTDDSESLSSVDASSPSKQKMHARRCLIVTVLIVVSTVFATCVWGIVDSFAAIAACYTIFVMLLQFWMMEWPQCDWRPTLLISMTVAVFSLPSLLLKLGAWNLEWRLVSAVLDVALVVATYYWCIRGPAYEPELGSMKGRVVIITGSNTGIGLVTASTLAKAGATIIFACRTESKAREAMKQVLSDCESDGVKSEQLKFIALDLSSLKSVRSFVQTFQGLGLSLHVLICNAGAFFPTQSVTADGLDACLAANHFGHFLLIQLLLPAMLATEAREEKPRIVFVSSALAYEQKAFDFSQARKVQESEKANFLSSNKETYEVFQAYGQSKIGQMLCMSELARRLECRGSQIPVNAVHPGEIDTDITGSLHPALASVTKIFKPLVRLVLKSPYQGSRGSVYAAASPSIAVADDMSGEFMMRLKPIVGSAAWLDENECIKGWERSIELTQAPEVPGADV